MDREKAIDLLDNLIGMIEDNQENDYDEALKMGINALAIQLAEPTEEQIKAYIRKRKMVLVEDDFMKHIIKGTPQAYIYKGMTNGEVIKTLFPNGKVLDKDECIGFEIIFDDGTSFCSFFDGLWWNSPYSEGSDKE